MKGWISLLHIILTTHHVRCSMFPILPPLSQKPSSQSSHSPIVDFPESAIKNKNNPSSERRKLSHKTKPKPLFGSLEPSITHSGYRFATLNSSVEFSTVELSLGTSRFISPSQTTSSPSAESEFPISNLSLWNSNSSPPHGTHTPIVTVLSSSGPWLQWQASQNKGQTFLLSSPTSSFSSSPSTSSSSSSFQSTRQMLGSDGRNNAWMMSLNRGGRRDRRASSDDAGSIHLHADAPKNRKEKRSAKSSPLSKTRTKFISQNTWSSSDQPRKSFRNRNSDERRSENSIRHPNAEEEMSSLRFEDYFLEDNIYGKGTMPAEEMNVVSVSPTASRTPSVFSPSNSRSHFRCRRNAHRRRRSALRCKRRSFLGGGPPSFHPSSPKNITAQLGASAYLPCRIKNLGNKSVSWFRKRDSHILTVDRTTFIADDRFSAWHEGGTQSWTLRIQYVQFRDAGDYECQVSTVPKMSHTVRLTVLKPSAQISGAQDQFVRAGSTVSLSCELRNAVEEPSFIFWYQNGLRLVHTGDSKRTISPPVRTATDRHMSSLTIARAVAADSGNYTCAPASIEPASVTLHVLHDEHPAAMQHGTTNAAAVSTAAATTAVTAAVIYQLALSANVGQRTAAAMLAIIGSTIIGSTLIGQTILGTAFFEPTISTSTKFSTASTLSDVWWYACERCNIIKFSILSLVRGVIERWRKFLISESTSVPKKPYSRFGNSRREPDKMENITVTELKFRLVPQFREFIKDSGSQDPRRNIRACST